MSERSFYRRFTEAVGSTPGEWLIDVRVDEARRLLESGSCPVEEVARLSGFGSVAAMRYHFAAATGLSPSEYRHRFTLGTKPGMPPIGGSDHLRRVV